MSKISFPTNPIENETFVANNISYVFAAGRWKNVSVGTALSTLNTNINTEVVAAIAAAIADTTTDSVVEGTTNLYYTDTRVKSVISVSGDLSYNSSTGVISYTAPTLATVATTGSYNDLTNRPTLATVATTGSYNDLTNTPTIPTTVSSLTNDAGYVTSLTTAKITVSVSAPSSPSVGDLWVDIG